jgi:hypothetical protein
MGGHSSLPMAVQCVPDRVLSLVLEYSEDLYIGSLENSAIKLRDSSRHKTTALCLNWWRIRRSEGETLAIERAPFPTERCDLRRVRVRDELSLSHSSVTFAGPCGLLSNSYIHASFNMSTCREPGKTVWIWDQQHVAICSSPTKSLEIRNIAALSTFNHVVAVNRRFILAAREMRRFDPDNQARSFQAQVFGLEPPHTTTQPTAIAVHSQLLYPRPIEVSVMAASFVDASSSEFLVVGHDFSVSHTGESKVLGNLRDGERWGAGTMRTEAWSCALLYEGEAGSFVFCFCAKMLATRNFFFHILRFTTGPGGFKVKASWRSHPGLWCTSFYIEAATKIDCSIDTAPLSSSLIIYQSREVLVGFDRKTLCGSKRGLRLPHASSNDLAREIYAPFDVGYSRVVCESLPCRALSVVVHGIRLSKEKRFSRQNRYLA